MMGETIIARSHREFGEAHGNYEEFRFFTGLRQSEQIALTVHDYDLVKGQIKITKALVRGRAKDRTKTREDREVTLCGRALEVLKAQLALRESMVEAGALRHEMVFFQQTGVPIVDLSYPYDRWRYVLEVEKIRYQDAYNARHSFISWSLMINKNLLKLAEEDGHSVATMLSTYAKWTKGATQVDVDMIQQSMARRPALVPCATLRAPDSASSEPVEPLVEPQTPQWGRLSWRKYKQTQASKDGGADGTRNRRFQRQARRVIGDGYVPFAQVASVKRCTRTRRGSRE